MPVVPEFPPLLEPGPQVMAIDAVRTMCVTNFPGSTTRPDIMDGLEQLLEAMEDAGISGEVWVDGSFMTGKEDPNDVDMVVILSGDDPTAWTQEQRDVIDQLSTPGYFKSTHKCDHFVVFRYSQGHNYHADGENTYIYWRGLVGFDRNDAPKGFATVTLP